MTILAVAGLLAVIGFAVSTFAAFAAVALTVFAAGFSAVAAFSTAAAFVVTAFAATAGFATVAATVLAAFFATFTAAGFSIFAAFGGFFARAFVGHTTAFAVDTRRFVLAEAGATPSVASTDARQRKSASGAKHEERCSKHRRQALLHERSFTCSRGRPAGLAHRTQLYSIERKRVECGAPIAKHVGDVFQVIGERLVFV